MQKKANRFTLGMHERNVIIECRLLFLAGMKRAGGEESKRILFLCIYTFDIKYNAEQCTGGKQLTTRPEQERKIDGKCGQRQGECEKKRENMSNERKKEGKMIQRKKNCFFLNRQAKQNIYVKLV